MENSIIGDSVKKGLLEITEDVENAIRGNRLPTTLGGTDYYLSKPIEIKNVDYTVAGYGGDSYLFVASFVLECVKLFNITLP